ncbi:MAG: 5-formyltetrahydrofolate cyclo-ligase [Verrucomicrobia bacterium]|nr:5-formyltetrahydrofolate cyclo-ligase [Verrucomicrobiota bacterium]
MNSPAASLPALKSALREDLRRQLRGLEAGFREEWSLRIRERCLELPEWSDSQVVGLYHPRADEPDVWPLVERAWSAGKCVVLPTYDEVSATYQWCRIASFEDLVPGRFGISEPRSRCDRVDAVRLDLAFVPGLGFSTDGGRLGRGQGFYDRLLKFFRGRSYGVAFDFQMLPQIPREGHDVELTGVITPSICRFVPSGVPQKHGY